MQWVVNLGCWSILFLSAFASFPLSSELLFVLDKTFGRFYPTRLPKC